ncbi:hypothetical protein MCGE09_00547 [Thaumarchaeota archaeon SCGC AB-539-E09]|nr:hypothetical protein MCGE09_00547 [Thaumarchaeota archaeon SCGC AB-539-E09]
MDESKIFICNDFYYGDLTMEKGRKIYHSFHDIPQRTYEAPYAHEYPISKGFSKTELTHLLIAMGTLTIAFSFAFAAGIGGIINGVDLYSVLQVIPLSFFGILSAFFFHELAHRFVARKSIFGLNFACIRRVYYLHSFSVFYLVLYLLFLEQYISEDKQMESKWEELLQQDL